MNRKIKLLLVEEECELASIIIESLEAELITVSHAVNLQEGMNRYYEFRPDICLIDVMIPLKDGISLVREIRALNDFIPLIVLSSNKDLCNVLLAFKAGVDDYLRKPFSIQELIFRIRALLKRGRIFSKTHVSSGFIFIGNYVFDPYRHELTYNHAVKRLSKRESDILKTLTDNMDVISPRKELLLELWGDDSVYNSRSLDVYVTKIRRYLSQDQRIKIINVRSRGYRLLIGIDF